MSHSKQQGITLIESLLTVLIISTAFISLTKLQLSLWKTTQGTQLIAIASSLAYAKMDDIRFQFYHSSSAQESGSTTKTQLNTPFICTWQTKELASGALRIKIEVTWHSRSIHLETTQHTVNRSIRSLLTLQNTD